MTERDHDLELRGEAVLASFRRRAENGDRYSWAAARIDAMRAFPELGFAAPTVSLPPSWDVAIPLSRDERVALAALRLLVERGVIRRLT